MDETTILFGTEDGKLVIGDAVLRDGQLWLVPEWRESKDGAQRMPARAIRMPMEAVQRTEGAFPAQFLLSGSVPTLALLGQNAELLGLRFVVLEAPEWNYPKGRPN